MANELEKRILLVEDHKLVRKVVRALLEKEMDMKVIGELGRGKGIMEQIKELRPDVVLLDLNLPDISGLELLKRIKERFLKMKVVVLSMYSDAQIVSAAKNCGANGFIAKEDIAESLVKAIRELGFHKTEGLRDEFRGLTSRERQVLKLIGEGLTTPEIANLLKISKKTVNAYREHICKKLDIHNTTRLIVRAIRNKDYLEDKGREREL